MYRLDFTIQQGEEEDFSERLFNDGADSISTHPGSGGTVHLSAIFGDNSAARPYLAMAEIVEELEESVWKYRWLEDFHGYALNSKVFIYPVTSSIPLATEYPITIYLDPRDAFGDGRHPTTVMCLSLLYDLVATGAAGKPEELSLFDAGTGTGILTILASLLGVGTVDAIDVDETSVLMALKNLKLNSCSGVTVTQRGIEDVTPTKRYDIVTANLLSGIITDNIDRLINLIKPGGTLIASGISQRWESEMEELFAGKGLFIEEKRHLEDWLAYRLKAG